MDRLYHFKYEVGRHGKIEGLFVADDVVVRQSFGRHIHMDDVLGKHSEIFVPLSDSNLMEVTDDPDFIRRFRQLNISVGYNPLEYLSDEEDED